MRQSRVEIKEYLPRSLIALLHLKLLNSYMLCKLIRYLRIYEAHTTPAFNGSSVTWLFKRSDVFEICDGIIFDFYTRLSHNMYTNFNDD